MLSLAQWIYSMKINWHTVIMNLRKAGLTYEAISKKCNIDSQVIGHLSRYEVTEPKFSTGQSLLNLHFDVCKNKHNLKDLLN